jgi:hypothetical protein
LVKGPRPPKARPVFLRRLKIFSGGPFFWFKVGQFGFQPNPPDLLPNQGTLIHHGHKSSIGEAQKQLFFLNHLFFLPLWRRGGRFFKARHIINMSALKNLRAWPGQRYQAKPRSSP